MAQDRRTLKALAALLPAGTLGLSVSLAAADAKATAVADGNAKDPGSVAERLQSIRDSVSGALSEVPNGDEPFLKVDPEKRLAWWGNGWHNGWHNGGWGNGWHNGGWGNGWHNGGWGNGGWGNGLLPFIFGSPWGNGWHNGWHNW
jgi:rSAM-associated Gly-rich repeat protein